jgi:type IV secretory pathway component VirB8
MCDTIDAMQSEREQPTEGEKMNLSTEDYLRAICAKQERTISLLKYLCWMATFIAVLLLGARLSWWAL